MRWQYQHCLNQEVAPAALGINQVSHDQQDSASKEAWHGQAIGKIRCMQLTTCDTSKHRSASMVHKNNAEHGQCLLAGQLHHDAQDGSATVILHLTTLE